MLKKLPKVLFIVASIAFALSIVLHEAGLKPLAGIAGLVFHLSLIVAFSIVPSIPSYQPRWRKIQLNLFYYGVSLLFVTMMLKNIFHPHHGEGFTMWSQMQLIPALMIAASGIFYGYLFATGQTTHKIPVRFSSALLTQLSPGELKQFEGTYENKTVSLSITFSAVEGVLMARATDQSPFRLQPIGPNIFRNDQVVIAIEFDLSADSLIIYQHGREFPFVKVSEL